MEQEVSIEVKNLKKRFKVYLDKGHSLKDKMLFWHRNTYEERWVLNGISFNVHKGEAVGLIGKNGCGKSTTLKLLTKIMYPTSGSVKLEGRVSSLIELGAGFHPDMSGRENIYINASIFGLSKEEIDKRVDSIIEFSELEDYIENPVRTYSSGMYMRLAFAVAISVDADILLIDEILAVGDVNFQTKCFEKLMEIKSKGTTIVIVSHEMGQIQKICDKVIWIENGLVKEEGPAAFVGEHYLGTMEDKRLEKLQDKFEEYQNGKISQSFEELKHGIPSFCMDGATRHGNHKIVFKNLSMKGEDGKEKFVFKEGEKIQIQMDYLAEKGLDMNFTLSITREDGVYCFGTSALSGCKGIELKSKEEGSVLMCIDSNNLLSGNYLLDIGVQSIKEEPYDYINNAYEFRIVEDESNARGIVNLERHWCVDGNNLQ